MIGLIGVGDDGTLYAPSGKRLMKLPLRLARWIQKMQHMIARLTQ